VASWLAGLSTDKHGLQSWPVPVIVVGKILLPFLKFGDNIPEVESAGSSQDQPERKRERNPTRRELHRDVNTCQHPGTITESLPDSKHTHPGVPIAGWTLCLSLMIVSVVQERTHPSFGKESHSNTATTQPLRFPARWHIGQQFNGLECF